MKKAFKDQEDYMTDIFYHDEPLHIAEDIAKGKTSEQIMNSRFFDEKTEKALTYEIAMSRPIELSEEDNKRYFSIRERYGW